MKNRTLLSGSFVLILVFGSRAIYLATEPLDQIAAASIGIFYLVAILVIKALNGAPGISLQENAGKPMRQPYVASRADKIMMLVGLFLAVALAFAVLVVRPMVS